jgi:transcriptional regulator of acetoin/glycerol metabolism
MWSDLPTHLRVADDHLLLHPRQVQASHDACRQSGVDPGRQVIADTWERPALDALLARHARLIAVGRDVALDAHRLIGCKAHAFILTDAEPRTLDLVAVAEVYHACAQIGLRAGAALSEPACGTNALALALQHRQPVATRGEQHFCRLFGRCALVAAPLTGRSGAPRGCIALVAPAEAGLAEKLALVASLARQIDERLAADAARAPAAGTETAAPALASLTPRQRHVATLLVAGLSHKQIAARLAITPRTVETHVERMRQALGARTTLRLVALLAARGLGDGAP